MTVTSTFRSTVGEPSVSPLIYSLSVLLADTEYVQALTPSTKQLKIRSRDGSVLRLAFASGETATNYITIAQGACYTSEGLDFTGSLYLRSNKAGQTIEIEEWS